MQITNRATHELIQGSEEWHQYRRLHRNASDAAAMMGIWPHKTRDALLKEVKTGVREEPSEAAKRKMEEGHKYERLARVFAEQMLGDDVELFMPIMSAEVNGVRLSASFDGLTLLDDIVWEHKSLNKKLEESLSKGLIPDEYKPQLEQQLMVSGAEKCLFMASNGTEESALHVWYKSDPTLREAIIDGWVQFEKDLAAYEVKEEKTKPMAEYIPALPALRVQISGAVTTSNLGEYKQAALAYIKSINTNLVSDQDFANAEETIKFLKKAEKELKQARENILAQAVDINEILNTMIDLLGASSTARLTLEKQVKTQKEVIKASIADQAEESLQIEWESLVENLNPAIVPTYCPVRLDIATAMKGKKSIESCESAANDELARAKIEATKLAAKFEANLTCFDEEANKHKFLFNDIAELVHKETGDFKAVVLIRIADHEEREKARIEAERERIAAEERAKLQSEQAEKEAEQAEPVQHELTCAREFAEEKTPDPLSKAKKKAKTPLMTTLKAWAKSKGLNDSDVIELIAILTEYNYQSDAA